MISNVGLPQGSQGKSYSKDTLYANDAAIWQERYLVNATAMLNQTTYMYPQSSGGNPMLVDCLNQSENLPYG